MPPSTVSEVTVRRDDEYKLLSSPSPSTETEKFLEKEIKLRVSPEILHPREHFKVSVSSKVSARSST